MENQTGGRSNILKAILNLQEVNIVKSVHFGHLHSYLFAPVNARVHRIALCLSDNK